MSDILNNSKLVMCASLNEEKPKLIMNGHIITQREIDEYINVTEICQAGGKCISNYTVSIKGKNFLKALSKDTNIPIKELIMYNPKSPKHDRATWAHPQVATNIAQWISSEFAVQITKWIEEWKKHSEFNQIKFNTAINEIKPDHNAHKERDINERICREINGKSEVKTSFGIADIISDEYIIEIKVFDCWKNGIGQLLAYSEDHPNLQKRLHLFDIPEEAYTNKITKFCAKLDIVVTFE